jgi:hypothetical protein
VNVAVGAVELAGADVAAWVISESEQRAAIVGYAK